MTKLIELLLKNFKLLLRSRFSAFIIIAGPVLIMLLAGIAFSNTNQYSISVASYSPSYNELTESFVSQINSDYYSVEKADSEESCIEGVRKGIFHVCMVFPENFAVGQANQNQINFYVDYSKINLVWMVIDSLSSEISETSSQLSLNMTSNIIQQIEYTESALQGKDEVIDSLLEKNTQIQNIMISIDSKASAMDLSFDSNEFNTAGLSSSSSSLNSFMEDAIDESNDVVDEVSELVEDIEDEVYDMNLSASERNTILSITSSINNSISAFSGNITLIDNSSSLSYSQLRGIVDSISGNIDDLESKLSTASSSKSSILSDIDSVQEKLSSSRVSLLDLQAAVESIQQGLSSVSVRNAADIVSPTDLKINPVVAEKTHLNYFFPSLLALIIMFVSIILSSNIVMMEKTSSASFRNHITPTRGITFLAATYITCLLIMAFQISLLLIISSAFFDLSSGIFSSGFITLGVIALFVSTMFIFFGMFLGYILKSRETAILGAISFSTIFFVLSDAVVPVESIPRNLSFLTEFNPFMISISLFRQAAIFNQNISSLGFDFYLLLGFTALFCGLAMASLARFKKNRFISGLEDKEHEIVEKVKQKKKSKKQ